VPVTGTLINAGTVLAGTAIGTLVGERMPERIRETVMDGLGLVTLVVGIYQGLATFRPPLTELPGESFPVVLIGSILVGGILGELVGIERGLNRFGESLRKRFGRRQRTFTEGFVVASLVFCVGPLTILGSLQDGLFGDYSLLAIKAALDGFAALAFASALGWGVGFSVIVILGYQGGLSVAAGAVEGIFNPITIAAITATGGVLILAIGLRLLQVREIRVANLLPALALAPVAAAIIDQLR
jgi:uncharacterized membrane protein YqgA involved in biofilm formation